MKYIIIQIMIGKKNPKNIILGNRKIMPLVNSSCTIYQKNSGAVNTLPDYSEECLPWVTEFYSFCRLLLEHIIYMYGELS